MATKTPPRFSLGLSLIEVLLVVALASLLMWGVLRVYQASRMSDRLAQGLASIQNTGRFVSQLLRQKIKAATAVQGFPKAPSWLRTRVKKGSDILVLTAKRHYKGKLQSVETAYFVAVTARKNSVGKKLDALYEKIRGSRRDELAEGVTQISLLFGLGSPAVQYHKINQMENGVAVKVVQVNMWLSSLNPVLQYPVVYAFNNEKSRYLLRSWGVYAGCR